MRRASKANNGPQPPGINDRPDALFNIQRAGLMGTLNSLGQPVQRQTTGASKPPGGLTKELSPIGEENMPADYSMSSRSSTLNVGHQNPAFVPDQITNSDDDDDDDDDEEFGRKINFAVDNGSSYDSSESGVEGPDPEANTFEKRTEQWNVFTTLLPQMSRESMEAFYASARKCLKVFTYIIMIPFFLALLVLSKGSLLVAISNVRPYPITRSGIEMTTESTTTVPNDYSRGSSLDLRALMVTDNTGTIFDDTTTISTTDGPPQSLPQMTCKAYLQTVYTMQGNSSYPIPVNYTKQVSKCVTLPWGFEPRDSTDFYCLDVHDNDDTMYFNGTQFSGNQCFVMRNYWIWSILLMIITPNVFTFARCMWRVTFKKKRNPQWKALISVLITETLHTIGVSLLAFLVLPSLNDAITALLMMLSTASIPAIMKILLRPHNEERRVLHIILDFLAIIGQLSVSIIWPLGILAKDMEDKYLVWAIPTSLILISVRWWENYLDENSFVPRKMLNYFVNDKKNLKRSIASTRTKVQLLASIWKVGITIIMMMVCVAFQAESMDPLHNERSMNPWTAVFNFDLSWCEHFNNVTNETLRTITYNELEVLELDWVWVWLVNCTASLVAYFFARSAAKMQIQRLCYSLPLVLTTPLMFGLMIGGCELWNNQPCSFATNELSGYLFYKCYEVGKLTDTLLGNLWFLLPIWWLSQLWITWHIWFPKNERLASAERLFVLPLYDGIIFEQSMMLNRRREDRTTRTRNKDNGTERTQREMARDDMVDQPTSSVGDRVLRLDKTPYVYICATMWHETEEEMIQMLKSIFRLDIDQSARKNAMKHFGIVDPDYYEFEGHIFFDQAFNPAKKEGEAPEVNDYVKLLVDAVNPAAREIHKCNIVIPPPEKIITPYGGRLVWTMPGGNKIIAHLKDSAKIRHKKRWSQVMYMYYFLAYKLYMDKLSPMRKSIRADNTFLLALDGDVDFEPIALQLVVDLMKRNDNVAAACGRIHPTGSGPMVWYQKFEYALGHWMQKSTEHVIGCVLCSPGCFSLFRGSALMRTNIMHRYTTKSTEPRHFIQYDQGEDRWLCTLLLQQGFRVEYCAASDSFTKAPEEFAEFFHQRRRWMPSTMANVMDLLQSWRLTTKVNENISIPYIIYQTGLLGASIVGPGTIFMMMIGAIDVALGGRLGFLWSTILNLIPLVIFIILCYVAKADVQIKFASFLTAVYILVQMLVLIGILVQMATMGICFPTTIFFLFVAGTFIFAGVIHPQEFLCVIHGFTYYLAIPTMYMLLMIFAMCNLHVVSWGTREVKQTPTEKEIAAEKAAQQEQELKRAEREKQGILSSVFKQSADKNGWTVGCGSLFSCTCCPREISEDERLLEIKLIHEKIKNLEREITTEFQKNCGNIASAVNGLSANIYGANDAAILGQEGQSGAAGVIGYDGHGLYAQALINTDADDNQSSSSSSNDDESQNLLQSEILGSSCHHDKEKDLDDKSEIPDAESIGPAVDDRSPTGGSNDYDMDIEVGDRWILHDYLGETKPLYLPDEERVFFEDLITLYLKPLIKDAEEEEKVNAQLKELRNRMSSSFLLLNGVFVVVIFVMQLNMDVLYVPWPCGDDVKIEPLGFVFMVTFGLIMVIQIVGMIIHRTTTFFHIMSTTILRCGRKHSQEDTVQGYIELAKEMGRLKPEDKGTASTRRTIDTVITTLHGGLDDQGQKKNLPIIQQVANNAKRARPRIDMTIGQAFEQARVKLELEFEKQDESNEDDKANHLLKTVLGRDHKTNNMRKEKMTLALKTMQQQRQSVAQSGNAATNNWQMTNGNTGAIMTGARGPIGGPMRRVPRTKTTRITEESNEPPIQMYDYKMQLNRHRFSNQYSTTSPSDDTEIPPDY